MAKGHKDKVAVITGAAGGIGQAFAKRLAEDGVHIAVADLGDSSNTVKMVEAAGRQAIAVKCDVASEASVAAMAREVGKKFSAVDIVVNCAGIFPQKNFPEMTFADWRTVLSINLDGTFLGCKSALPLLKRGGGSIVNLSSISGIVGGHNLAAYNASKGGVRLLTKSIALHGARLKPPVRCNSLHPAFLEGPMVEDILAQTGRPEVARGQLARDIPLGRLGQPAEVAELCVYLLSDESAFVTGAEFAIDGGLTAR